METGGKEERQMKAEGKRIKNLVEEEKETLGFWHDKTPCWEMCHCPENIRNECPAPKYPTYPCWEIEGTYLKLRDDGSSGCDTHICRVCRVYTKYGQGKPIQIKLFNKGVDARLRLLKEKAEVPDYQKEVRKMTYFMCQYCGYLLSLELEKSALPDKCPGCAQVYAFVNITGYTPEHGEKSPDPRTMAYILDENRRKARVDVPQRTPAVVAHSNALCYQAALIGMRQFRDQLKRRPEVRPVKKPILVVDDEAIMREYLRDWLTDSGYRVETAEDGEKALDTIAEQDFGVVILDLRLPGKDGIEVLKEAKERKPQLKGIIITAYPSVQTAVKAVKEGAIDYLPKPFDMNHLERLIRQTLGPVQVEIKPTGVTAEVKAKHEAP